MPGRWLIAKTGRCPRGISSTVTGVGGTSPSHCTQQTKQEEINGYVFEAKGMGDEIEPCCQSAQSARVLAETVPDRCCQAKSAGTGRPDETVGVGGSVSIREAGIIEALQARGTMVNHHWLAPFGTAERLALRRKTLTSDWYLASANALSETGEVVNIDGVGDRIAAMIFAVPKVILVVGRNKLALL